MKDKNELDISRREILENPQARQAYHEELKRRRQARYATESNPIAQRVRDDAARWRRYRRMGKTLAKGGCL